MAQQPSALSLFPSRVIIGFVGNDPQKPIYMSAEFYRALNKLFTNFGDIEGEVGGDVFASMFGAVPEDSFDSVVQLAGPDADMQTIQQAQDFYLPPEMLFQQGGGASGVSGGSAGAVLWQSEPNVTSFTAVGTAGQVLLSGGTTTPTWTTGTLTLGTNLSTTGGAITLTATGATNVTLPTAGTLATLAGAESLTNKKLGSLTSNGLVQTSGGDGTLSVLTPGTGVATALAVAVGTDGAFVVNGGALGSPSSAGTLPAFTLGGTVTLNGQSFSGTCANGGTFTTIDINGGTVDGAAIGGSSASTGSFTTLTASGVFSLTGNVDHYVRQGCLFLWTSDGTIGGTRRGSIYADSSGNLNLTSGGTTTHLQLDSSGNLTLSAYGTGGAVTVGAADSGGAGYKVLRVPN